MSIHTPRSPCSPASIQAFHGRHMPSTYFDTSPDAFGTIQVSECSPAADKVKQLQEQPSQDPDTPQRRQLSRQQSATAHKPALHTPRITTTASSLSPSPSSSSSSLASSSSSLQPSRSANTPLSIKPISVSQVSEMCLKAASSNRARPSPALPPGSPQFALPPLVVPPGAHALAPRKLLEFVTEGKKLLVVDVRPYASYSHSRIHGAVNICIPSTLLKRPTFVVSRFTDCVALEHRALLEDIGRYEHIVLYDQNAPKDLAKEPSAQHATLVHTLRKFDQDSQVTATIWYVEGGFQAAEQLGRDLVDDVVYQQPTSDAKSNGFQLNKSLDSSNFKSCKFSKSEDGEKKASRHGSASQVQPFSLMGFSIPSIGERNASFFNSKSSLSDKYGSSFQPAISWNMPKMPAREVDSFPKWIRDTLNEGSVALSDQFRELEAAEKSRLQGAFSGTAPNPTTKAPESPGVYSIAAGVDLGNKNRYHNIWPYDHSRVRVPTKQPQSCDYINASHVTSKISDLKYIATQGPLPDTTGDFWTVVWNENVSLIVMLTAEYEGGHVKCHPYWKPGTVSDGLVLEGISEQELVLNQTTNSKVVIRKLNLVSTETNSTRSVTQIHYTSWPDLGLPADPCDAVSLVALKKQYHLDHDKPVVVHCSAGCGRTGTFCTIDTVIDVLENEREEGDSNLVYEVVKNFRRQRLSMVQSLRQYVLCYEAIVYYLHKKWQTNHPSE